TLQSSSCCRSGTDPAPTLLTMNRRIRYHRCNPCEIDGLSYRNRDTLKKTSPGDRGPHPCAPESEPASGGPGAYSHRVDRRRQCEQPPDVCEGHASLWLSGTGGG